MKSNSTTPHETVFTRQLKRILDTLYTSNNSIARAAEQFFKSPESAGDLNLFPELSYIAEKILSLTEGANATETLTRSAKMLGTLQLTVPQSTRRWREIQFGFKPLYRVVLTLRLLDHVLLHKLLPDDNLQLLYAARRLDDADCPFRLEVQIPLVIAVLLLDSGLLHPKAAAILLGNETELDPLRALTADERTEFNHISRSARQQLAKLALTLPAYRGNSKQEQQQYRLQQQQRLNLIQTILANLDEPQSLLGNIAKIPQVYSSVVLPGRTRFVYESLPKVALILKEGAKRQHYSARYVDQFLRITGIFPQGYGIAYVPKQTDLSVQEKYEMAIVTQLYPDKPEEPICRIVSRNLQYRRGGHNCKVSVEHNLYFKPARDKLSIMPEQRLRDILSKLSADWQPGQVRRFVPRCWHPADFFSRPEHQNLWNQAPQTQN